MEPPSGNSQSPARRDKPLVRRLVLTSSAIVLVWLSTIYFGGPTATWELDDSWNQSLGYALEHDLQAGVDFIFTFGPLGYLYSYFAGYDAELFNGYVMWQLVMGLFLALILVAQAHHISGTRDKVIYLSLITVVVSSFPHDAIYFLAIIAAVILAINPPPFARTRAHRQLALEGVVLLFLALVCMTKFSHFVLASAGVAALTAVTWHAHSRRRSIAIPLAFALLVTLAWLVSGQALSNVPAFVVNSLRVARGYSDAMPLAFIIDELILAALSMAAMAVMLAGVFASPRKFTTVVTAVLVSLGTYIAWKSGFVRQPEHAGIFFAFATIAPFFVGYNGASRLGTRRTLTIRYFAVGVALAGLFVAGSVTHYTPVNFVPLWAERVGRNVVTLVTLPKVKARLDERVAELKQEFALPKIRARVGRSPVDIMSWGQGLIFLNELTWRPRPVFQSYVAFTPELISINGDFYAGERAPEFVIFRLQAIDKQFPLMNDNEALKILLRDYRPVLAEDGYVLLARERRGQGRAASGETLMEKEIRFGETVDIRALSDRQLLLTLEIRKSLLGRLGTLLFKLAPSYIDMQTVDGSSMLYRIVPGMTQSGFLINPLILTQEDFVGWYTEGSAKQLATFRIEARSRLMRGFFAPRISMRISEFSTPPYPVDEETRQSLEENVWHPFSSGPR